MPDLFPALDADQLAEATKSRWDLSGPLPAPKGDWLRCPVCRHDIIQARYWRYHRQSGQHTIPYRCDVSFKCTSCAAVWPHGVVIPEEMWRRVGGRGQVYWRQARKMIEEADSAASNER